LKAVTLRLKLLGLALICGLAIVLIANGATDIVLGQPLFADGAYGSIDAPDVAVMHLVGASLPMVILALVGTRLRLVWMSAVLLTAIFWAFFVVQIWLDSLNNFEGGADIGLGLIMMASPFLILLALIPLSIAARIGRKPAPPSP
jgi:hypothetical protein